MSEILYIIYCFEDIAETFSISLGEIFKIAQEILSARMSGMKVYNGENIILLMTLFV